MAKTIDIGTAQKLQFGSFVQLQVVVYTDGVITSEKYYTFNANQFSCVYDNANPNTCVMHFDGNSLTISNGDYSSFASVGVSKASVVALAASVVADIAQHTT